MNIRLDISEILLKASRLSLGIELQDGKTTKCVQMVILGWPWTILLQNQINFPVHFYGGNVGSSFFEYINPCPAEPGYTLPLQTV